MPAYVIADLEVTDPTGFEEYRRRVLPTIEQFGGRYLVRGGAHEVVEGGWRPKRVVVVEFPSMAQLRRWYDSEEYRGPKAIRLRTARTDVVVVEGV